MNTKDTSKTERNEVALNFLDVTSQSGDDFREILSLSRQPLTPILKDLGVALIFEKPSLRTRNSSEMAVKDLGGHPVYIQDNEVGFDKRESAEDIARVLSTYYKVIAARVFSHQVLVRMSNALLMSGANTPIVNLLSDVSHPCQAVADLLTISDYFPDFARVSITYVGDSNNVARSLAQACALVGSRVRIASPVDFSFDEATKGELGLLGDIEFYDDPLKAVAGANVVYTDTWTSMGEEDQASIRREVFSREFTVDSKMMASASEGAIFMHCLPAHRGEEVTNEVIESSASVVFEQAANRRDAFRGVLRKLCATT